MNRIERIETFQDLNFSSMSDQIIKDMVKQQEVHLKAFLIKNLIDYTNMDREKLLKQGYIMVAEETENKQTYFLAKVVDAITFSYKYDLSVFSPKEKG